MMLRNFEDLSMHAPRHGSDSLVESVTSQFGTRSLAYQASDTSTLLSSTPLSDFLVTGEGYH
jgi:hypothetical protein